MIVGINKLVFGLLFFLTIGKSVLADSISPIIVEDRDVQKTLFRYLAYNGAIYCKSNTTTYGIELQEYVFQKFSKSPMAMIAYASRSDEIILDFRPLQTGPEWMHLFVPGFTKHRYGRVHLSFYKLYLRMKDDLIRAVKTALQENPDAKRFVILGFSIGALLATYTAYDLYDEIFEGNEDYLPELLLFSYGSPRPGDKEFALNRKFNHIRVINNNDVIAHWPAKVRGYVHTGDEFYIDRPSLSESGFIEDTKHDYRALTKNGAVLLYCPAKIGKENPDCSRKAPVSKYNFWKDHMNVGGRNGLSIPKILCTETELNIDYDTYFDFNFIHPNY